MKVAETMWTMKSKNIRTDSRIAFMFIVAPFLGMQSIRTLPNVVSFVIPTLLSIQLASSGGPVIAVAA